MPRLTKAMLEDKVKELEKIIKVSKEDYAKLEERCLGYKRLAEDETVEKLNKKLREAYDDLTEAFEKKHQLYDRIQILELDNQKLRNELKSLKENNHKLNNERKHNERGAGRKPKLTKQQQQEVINKYNQGVSMGNIAKEFNISKGLVHKIIHS